MSHMGRGCVKRARAENAQNCFLSFLFSTVTARAVLFLFNVIETNFLRASSASEFSHSLGQKRKLARLNGMSGPPSKADIRRKDRHVRYWPMSDIAFT